MVTVTVFR